MALTLTASPLPPGSTLGILGGGQLGRMLSQAASQVWPSTDRAVGLS